MDKEKTLFEQLKEYSGKGTARFHMPGHKGKGLSMPLEAKIDVTELPDTDDLYAPEGMLHSAQRRAARAFGAANTLFLVNGATAGVLAMLLSLGEGSSVAMGRDCHKSAISGAVLAGLDVKFIMPEHDAATGTYGVVDAKRVEATLKEFKAKAVFVTSPNYLGQCADLEAIAGVARKHNALLLVDASHGSHFPFSKLLPKSPAGIADMWVHSAHKTLCALGQSALLHLGPGMDVAEIRRALALIQTSSPSFILMAALDNAIRCAGRPGVWDAQAERAMCWRERIGMLEGVGVLGREQVGIVGISDVDVTRICIDVSQRGIDGYQAARELGNKGIAVEMADMTKLVLITAPPDENSWYERLYEALDSLPLKNACKAFGNESLTPHERVMSMRSAALSNGRWVKAEQAAGMVCGQGAGIYPSGIAEFLPGELIDEEGIARLQGSIRLGAKTFGMENGCLYCIEPQGHV